MSSLAAARVGIEDRGLIKPGYCADVVLLDPGRVADRVSIDNATAHSIGIQAVMVSGEFVCCGEDALEAWPGGIRRCAGSVGP